MPGWRGRTLIEGEAVSPHGSIADLFDRLEELTDEGRPVTRQNAATDNLAGYSLRTMSC